MKSSLRRKVDPPCNPTLIIPAISISAESDDERRCRKKKISISNDNRVELIGEDTDHDDESIEWDSIHLKRDSLRNNRTYSSSNETNPATPIDDEQLLARKQSKIGRVRLSRHYLRFVTYFQLIIEGNYVRN